MKPDISEGPDRNPPLTGRQKKQKRSNCQDKCVYYRKNVPAEVTTSLSVEEDRVDIYDPAVAIATRDAGEKVLAW